MDQLKAGAALNYILILLNLLITLVYTPYMLRMMGQNEYGLYALVASVISYLTVLDLGFGNALVRYTAKFRAEGELRKQYEMFGMFIVLFVCIGLLVIAFGAALYSNVDRLFGDTMSLEELSKARIMIVILIFNLALTFSLGIFGSIITAYERFVFPKIVNIIRVLLNTLIMVVLLYYGYKAIAMVVVQTVFNILTLIINYIYCKKKLHIKVYFRNFDFTLLKEIGLFSFWILLDVVMNQIYWNTGQFVLGAISGTAAVAVFAIAIQMESMYMQFSVAISSVFLPKVTGMVTIHNDNKELSNLFIKTGRVQNIIMGFILFAFIIFGKQFIVLWAGKSYVEAYYITLTFYIALYFPLIQNLGITILQARNQMKFRSLLYICISAVSLAFQILFAKKWGGLGCAFAISGALLLGQGVIMNIYYKKRQSLDILLFWKEIIKMNIVPILITVLFGVMAHSFFNLETWTSLISAGILYTICYLPLFYKFSMNREEKELLAMALNRNIS